MTKRPLPPSLSPGINLIDSHCHLDMDAYSGQLDGILQASAAAGVARVITIGIDLASSRKAVEIANKYPDVFATVGIHPHSAEDANEKVYTELSALAAHPKVVGYGEIGLDYAKQYAPIDVQQKQFARQLNLAKKLQLPVIIHDREAHKDTLKIITENMPFPAGGVLHCFSGDIYFAQEILDLGFYISIPGIVTFKNAKDLQEVAQAVPMDRILLETDGPFLAPVPWRGTTNRPDYLLYTAGKTAELRNSTVDEVARQTTLNAEKFFNLPCAERTHSDLLKSDNN